MTMLAAGTQLGPYKILAPLGAGGMGEVYRARDTKLGREVALKILPENFAGDPERRARFEREAQLLASLNHTNIAAIYGLEEANGLRFLVLELVPGKTLAERLSSGRLEVEEALNIARQIAEALEAAHEKGIIHRDLKPANVKLTAGGKAKVLDFGLAKAFAGDSAEVDLSKSPTITDAGTRQGVILGTAAYMSPEQARGKPLDQRTDIWSFGCVLYELLTGKRAFAGATISDTLAAILTREPTWQALPADTPASIQALLRRCLQKDASRRLQHIGDARIELEEAVSKPAPEPVVKPAAARPWWRSKPALTASAAALVSLVVLGTWFVLTRTRGEAIDSIAVLPFVNAGGDPNTEYLSDGITENLINSFSQLPKLRVIPRSRVFRYKGKEADAEKIGRELNVSTVLTGRVTQRGDSLNIQTELVDVAQVSQLWGRQYNRKFSEIITVQEEIAKEVSEKLRLRPTGEEQKKLTKRYTENPEAHQLYLKGRYLWNRRTGPTLQRAAGYFQQAIDKDPGYALAWAGLADCYALYSFYGVLSPAEAFPKAKEAARKALEIDDTLAEAHASLLWIKSQYDWDWVGAEREFKRTIELNPNYATVYNWYSVHLGAMGRLDEALALAKRAEEIEPLSLANSTNVGLALYLARQYDQAIEQLRRVLDTDANFPPAHLFLGLAYEQKGMFEEAIAEFQKGSSLSGGEPTMVGALGHAYAVSGRKDRAQNVLAELKQQSRRRYVAPFEIAVIYIGLGEKEQAFEWLEKAYRDHSSWLIWLKVDPRFDSLHGDSRYRDLRRRMGLPP